jgi:SAM-dependent methyltransferase
VVKGCTTAGIGCIECKQPVIDAIIKEQEPMHERAQQYLDDPSLVRAIVADGCDKARKLAQETMRDVREAMGLAYTDESGVAWVARWAPLIPDGEVLDLACGGGRHARHLAALGHPVLAVDRDPAALARPAAKGASRPSCMTWKTRSRPGPSKPGRFAGIVVTNYLHRPLLAQRWRQPARRRRLRSTKRSPGNEAFGKPSNPAFLLAPGELLEPWRRPRACA